MNDDDRNKEALFRHAVLGDILAANSGGENCARC